MGPSGKGPVPLLRPADRGLTETKFVRPSKVRPGNNSHRASLAELLRTWEGGAGALQAAGGRGAPSAIKEAQRARQGPGLLGRFDGHRALSRLGEDRGDRRMGARTARPGGLPDGLMATQLHKGSDLPPKLTITRNGRVGEERRASAYFAKKPAISSPFKDGDSRIHHAPSPAGSARYRRSGELETLEEWRIATRSCRTCTWLARDQGHDDSARRGQAEDLGPHSRTGDYNGRRK